MVKVSYTEKETIEMMQDDLLALSAEIDVLLDIFRALINGVPLPTGMVDEMLESAGDVSEEIFSRWEGMEFTEDED